MSTTWQDKHVLVVGGSRGLGLNLARAWHARGARIGIVGRDQAQLAAAASSFHECVTWSCDVTQDESVDQLFSELTADWSQLDVLVNAVGKSSRQLALSCDPADFQAAWETNFLSLVRCTRAAMPLLQQSGGMLVNIASLAARVAVANMGPYPVTKFAMAAYSQQLRFELRQQGSRVHVLLVCPGPIQRADAGTRYPSVDNVPERALQPGAGVRLKGIDPERLARMILRACERRQAELIVPFRMRFLLALGNVWPDLAERIVERAMR